MSYLNEGQLTTDQDTRGHMFIIPFSVLCECLNKLNRTKTTKIKKSKNQKSLRRNKVSHVRSEQALRRS